MTAESIINVCNKMKNGTFFNIRWNTSCEKKLTAEAKKQGIRVTKTVSSVCRKGVQYSHIKKVRENMIMSGNFLRDPKTGDYLFIIEPRKWAEDIIPNLLIKHKTTGKEYVVIYTASNIPKVQYYVNNKPVSIDEIKAMGIMQNSYWNTRSSSVLTVPIESIMSITQKGIATT